MKKKFTYLIITLIISLIFTYLIFSLLENREKEQLSAEKELVKVTYNTVIEAFNVHSNILYFNKINTEYVKNLLNNVNELSDIEKEKIRTRLYNEFIDMYENMNSFKLKQLHFHLRNNDSFLRFHRPKKYGDNLTGIRSTIEYVNKYNKQIHGFEEGRIFNGYRFVYPLNYNKNHIGSVEISVSMESIISEFRREMTNDVDFIIKKSVVDKKVFNDEKNNYKQCRSTKKFYHEKSISKGGSALIEDLVTNYIKANDIDKKLEEGKIFNFFSKSGENHYIITFFPIKNAVSNDTVGYIIVSNQHNDFIAYQNQYIIFLFILIILLFAMSFFIYRIEKDKELLLHQEEILDEVQKIGRLGYWELDLIKNHLTWSDEVYHLFGLKENEFNATYEDFLKYIHPDDLKKVNDAYLQSVKNKKSYRLEHRIVTKTGEIKYVEEECHHTFDKNGNIIQSLGTLHDITELKLYQLEIEKAKEQFESLVSHIPDIVYRSKSDEKNITMLYLNESIEFVTGYSSNELMLNRIISFSSIIHPDDIEEVYDLVNKTVSEEKKHKTIEYRIIRKDKEIIWVKDSFEIIKDKNDILIEGVISDITTQKEAYNKLQKFIDIQDNIVILTDGKKLDFANKKFFNFLGYKDLKSFKKEYECICDLFVENDRFFHLGKIDKEDNWIEVMKSFNSLERRVILKDTKSIEHVFSVTINNFEKDLLIVSFNDISETIYEQMKLEEKTIHDKLTGSYNREYFELNINKLISEVENTDYTIGIAIIDIDYFKKVNDNYGHDIGDSVLIEFVQEISKFSRNEDIVVRWGGEEFLLILKVRSKSSLEKALENIRSMIESNSFEYINTLTCSIGGSLYIKDEKIEDTIKRADTALYYSKANGRNRVSIN